MGFWRKAVIIYYLTCCIESYLENQSLTLIELMVSLNGVETKMDHQHLKTQISNTSMHLNWVLFSKPVHHSGDATASCCCCTRQQTFRLKSFLKVEQQPTGHRPHICLYLLVRYVYLQMWHTLEVPVTSKHHWAATVRSKLKNNLKERHFHIESHIWGQIFPRARD